MALQHYSVRGSLSASFPKLNRGQGAKLGGNYLKSAHKYRDLCSEAISVSQGCPEGSGC